MTKNPRFKVLRFEEHPNMHPESSKLWPTTTSAYLECGHVHNLGAGNSYRPKRMACYHCGDLQRAARRIPTFTYRCTDCGSKNDTKHPPEDCMLNCSRCGFMTVQTCDRVAVG